MRLHVLLIICCLAPALAPAQEHARAMRLYNKAEQYKAHKKSDKAYKYMEMAIKEWPAYTDAYSTLGEWYFSQHYFAKAVNTFRQAYNNCPQGNKAFARPFAKSLLYHNEPDSALLILNAYQPAKDNGEWQQMKDQALFMKQNINAAWADTAINMGPRINTPEAEIFPSVTADTQTFYFTRRTKGVDEDFYYAVPDSCGGWFTARNMGSKFNTPDREMAQIMSADGHYTFFTRCENRSSDGWDRGGCDLYMAYRVNVDSPWSTPQNFGATINTADNEAMPSLSPDNRELYFASDRPGGYGGYDIWVSRFEDGLWRPPHNLGPQINTAGNETAPFMHIDNKTLYFTSSGHMGMGGTDLFISKKISDTVFSTPVNMGYPINTAADEKSVFVSADGKIMYFASDRDSISGNFDIYEIALPPSLQPEPVNYVTGYVYDSLSKQPLNYASIYINNKAGNTLYHFQSNRGDGSFMITLPAGDYTCITARIGYPDVTNTLHIDDTYATTPIVKNIVMLPDDYVMPIYDTSIATIYFDHNSAKLTDSNIAMIKNAISPWVLEKGIIVQINGYTDNTGTPLINEQLSYERAGLVMQQITATGISDMAVKTHGWGEANAITTNDTEEGRAKNRRVEIIISR